MTVKSGAQFARFADDWKFFNGAVADTVRRHHEDGYKIVIFTCVLPHPYPSLFFCQTM